jgi:hypothetical protein
LCIHILSRSLFSSMRTQLSAENEKKTVRGFSVEVGRRATKIKYKAERVISEVKVRSPREMILRRLLKQNPKYYKNA